MKIWRRTLLPLAATGALAVLLVVPATAAATMTIYENRGVGTPRLGWLDSNAKKYYGHLASYSKDTSYPTVVYLYKFGYKMANGRFPLEMRSNSSHRVFNFRCYSAYYVTTKGVKVGTAESTLKSKYSGKLRRIPGSTYTHYIMGSKPYTDFWVKNGKVSYIVVRS